LTGEADFRNLHAQLVRFGSVGGGVAKVGEDASNAAEYQLQQTIVDPQGGFAGRDPADQALLAALSGLPSTELGVFSNIPAIIAGESDRARFTSVIGVLAQTGVLLLPTFWTGPAFSVVDYTVKSPLGELVSSTNKTAPSGGMYNTSNTSSSDSPTASASGFGQQEIDWANLLTGTFPSGNYTITDTLVGTKTQTLAQNPSTQITIHNFAEQSGANLTLTAAHGVTATLNAANPSVTYKITAPLTNSSVLTRSGQGK
jgi:hypothetical protein